MIKLLIKGYKCLRDYVFPVRVLIHYYGGGAYCENSTGTMSALEGSTDCWGTERFVSELTARRYIERKNLDLRHYNEEKKVFTTSFDVDDF